ncbi:failed axon connection [Ditylenchus destructor]|uniref:Failed axon connection n=1 Tax=Ditylenchus destructor TaxID=166010 RepID=A0AAD4R295_9BILA|nr:failed axon connection [Ditylenchus destructor]
MTLYSCINSLVLIVSTVLIFKAVSYLYALLTCRYKRKTAVLNKKDWEKDVVYLYQFPKRTFVPNVSAFCLKVETFLIHHGIKHEVIESMTLRSTEGKLPLVELNGRQIPDSQLIILELTKHFNLTERTDRRQKALDRILSRFVDHATSPAIYYDKIGRNASKFIRLFYGDAPFYIQIIATASVYLNMWQSLNGEGTGRHQPEEIREILHEDLDALDSLLGDNDWILGGEKPTLADIVLFAHIAGSYDLPFELPIHKLLEEKFPGLIAHHNRMAERYYPGFKFGGFKREEAKKIR